MSVDAAGTSACATVLGHGCQVKAGVEKVEIEVERRAGRDGAAVQMGGAKDEGTRPIGEAAGTWAQGAGFEHAGVGARRAELALARTRAMGQTGDLAQE